MTNTKDKNRKWMWWLLAVGVAFQLYFVRELLAAFALFAAGFAVIAMLVGSLFMLQHVWAAGVTRVAESQNGFVNAAGRGLSALEDLGRRPFRSPV